MGSRICPAVLSLSQALVMSCPCLELLPQVLCPSFGESAKKVLERVRTGPATWYIDDGQKHWYLSYVNPLRINKKKVNIQFSKKETGCSERKKYEETNRKHVQTCQLIHETRKPCVVLPTRFAVLWANRPSGARVRTPKILMGFWGSCGRTCPETQKCAYAQGFYF